MLNTERVIIDGRAYVRTFSDTYWIRGGDPDEEYTSATDPEDAGRVYVETDKLLPGPGDAELTDAEALTIITGEGGGAT